MALPQSPISINGAFVPPTGSVVQVVTTLSSAVATGTTTIPRDDTIPQNTEGDQYMSLAITPTNSNNLLIIECVGVVSSSAANESFTAALFQDTTANALAVGQNFQGTATASTALPIFYSMTAGTTSSTTFKVRIGGDGAGTTTFNGAGGLRKYGGITQSYMKITEVKV